MVVVSDITIFKTGYMSRYTNEEATPASTIVQITIDGVVVKSQAVEIPANGFVCLFRDWSGVDTSISHEICATIEEECPSPIPSFTHNGESCT